MSISETQKLGLKGIAVLFGLAAGGYRQLSDLLQPESADQPAEAATSEPPLLAPDAAGQ